MQAPQLSVHSLWAPTCSGHLFLLVSPLLFDLFAHNVVPPFLWQNSTNLAQSLTLDLCIWFCPLLNEGYMITVKVIISLVTKEGKLMYPLFLMFYSEFYCVSYDLLVFRRIHQEWFIDICIDTVLYIYALWLIIVLFFFNFLHLRFTEHCRRENRKIVRSKGSSVWLWDCIS